MSSDRNETVSSDASQTTLADLTQGQRGIVIGIADKNQMLKRRLTAFGMVRGTEITLLRTAPMGNPRAYNIMGYCLSLRNEDAHNVLLRVE
ncbi:ferrous iron transport protein A [Azospirillaceae bacterium]